jgi:uncharacterized protein YgbK (DUF1537 family)
LDDQQIPKSQLLNRLPDEWPHDLRPAIQKQVHADRRKIVVLDDDPTGTQTIHGLPVITGWSVDTLAAELKNEPPAFYILTNSRSYTLPIARQMNAEIGHNLTAAAAQAHREFVVISRSDSTLRGHFPGEVPFFLEGGRYTIDDVHYVAEGEMMVPAAQTEFAGDRAFGYSKSNLRDWIAEKTSGRIDAKEVATISIENLRNEGPESVSTLLMKLHHGQYCIVNAAGYRDLEVFVQGLLEAEARGKTFLFRTAASFVQVRAGIFPRLLLTQSDLQLPAAGGGLIVVGSYVPRSTGQVNSLLAATNIEQAEINVAALLDDRLCDEEINRVVNDTEKALRQGNDMLIFTSRQLVAGKDSKSSLQIGQKISQGLIRIVQRIQTAPRYILAKGGITSSDIATRALNVKKAIVLGQILPGVPVWQLDAESRFPNLAYIVFPGNVGDDHTLVDVVQQLKSDMAKKKKPKPAA